jgi:hypothetical protein
MYRDRIEEEITVVFLQSRVEDECCGHGSVSGGLVTKIIWVYRTEDSVHSLHLLGPAIVRDLNADWIEDVRGGVEVACGC